MGEINPCMAYGVCCAYFHVSFYWAEADDAGGLVPSTLTKPLAPFLHYMNGTNQCQSHCAALSSDIDNTVHRIIYEDRPSPCREFAMSGGNGGENDVCNWARACYGLPPLRPLYKNIPALNSAESATRERFAVQLPAS